MKNLQTSALQHCPGRSPRAIVLESPRSWKGAFRMLRALHVLQIREEDILNYSQQEPPQVAQSWLPNRTAHLQKAKWCGIYVVNPRRTWEKPWLTAHAAATGHLPGVSVTLSSELCWSVLSWGPLLLLVTSPLKARSARSRHLPGAETSGGSWSRDRPPASHGGVCVNLPTIALCAADSPPHYVGIAIPATLREPPLSGPDVARDVLLMRGTISHGHPWEVMPDLYRDLEGIEKEEQATAEKAVTKEELQGNRTSSWAHWCSAWGGRRVWGHAGDPCAYEQSPSEDGSAQPATEHWSAAPTQWVGTTAEWS